MARVNQAMGEWYDGSGPFKVAETIQKGWTEGGNKKKGRKGDEDGNAAGAKQEDARRPASRGKGAGPPPHKPRTASSLLSPNPPHPALAHPLHHAHALQMFPHQAALEYMACRFARSGRRCSGPGQGQGPRVVSSSVGATS